MRLFFIIAWVCCCASTFPIFNKIPTELFSDYIKKKGSYTKGTKQQLSLCLYSLLAWQKGKKITHVVLLFLFACVSDFVQLNVIGLNRILLLLLRLLLLLCWTKSKRQVVAVTLSLSHCLSLKKLGWQASRSVAAAAVVVVYSGVCLVGWYQSFSCLLWFRCSVETRQGILELQLLVS